MKDKEWFHCGRCGHLFQGVGGEKNMRRCTVCGEHPAPPLEGISEWRTPQTWSMPRVAKKSDIEGVTKQKRQVARRQRASANWFVVKLVVGWLLFAGMIMVAARAFWSKERTWAERNDDAATKPAMLDGHEVEECAKVFHAYLSAKGVSQRAQFVCQPAKMAPVISRHEEANAMPDIPLQGLAMTGAQMITLPREPMMLLRWQSVDGKKFDTVFRRENNEWRLDWAEFIQYSELPMHSFLEGQGGPVAEFRLLARERLANERRDGPELGVVFCEPRFGFANAGLKESPEFLLRRDSDDGRLLAAAFQAALEGRSAFGVTGEANPPGMIRVRVRLIRDAQGKCHIEKVVAAHWLSIDAPGF